MANASKPLLTKQKLNWVKQFKPTVAMKGHPLNYNASVQAKYGNQLTALVKQMTTEVKRQLKDFFKTETAKQYFASDDTVSSQARILTNSLTAQFEQLFGRKAKPYAEQMANGSAKASKTNLHSSLQKLSGGMSLSTGILTDDLDEVLNATVVENVGLIKSIASQYLSGVKGAVMRSITTGNGMQDLIPYLDKQAGITHRRARNIAYDQTRKAYNNINKHRMQTIGLKQFQWLHTAGEQKPRPLHEALSGQIFSFDNPPVIDDKTGERGIPGQLVNCGCRMVPVISFDQGQPTDGISNQDIGDDEGDNE